MTNYPDKKPTLADQRPTLADQHWRALLHRKKSQALEQEVILAIEHHNHWRLDIVLTQDPTTPRHEDFMKAAIEHNNMQAFTRLASLRPDWDKLYDLDSFAIFAALKGNLDFLRYFIEQKGVDLHARRDDMLIQACAGGHIQALEYLLSKGADPAACNHAALKTAAEEGRLEVIERLAAIDGVELDIENAVLLMRAAYKGHAQVVEFLLNNRVQDTNGEVMSCAAREGHLDILKIFIKHGAKGSDHGSKAFLDASFYGKQDAVTYLLAQGADINADNGAALRRAINYHDQAMLVFLLDLGADPNITHQRDTMLMQTVWSRDVDALRMLLKHGADHTAQQFEALRCAAERREREIVRALVDHDKKFLEQKRLDKTGEFKSTFGADYSVDDLRHKKGPSGQSGLLIAAQSGMFDKLLRKATGVLLPDDLYHPDDGADTVLSMLRLHKSLPQFFNADLWEARAADLEKAYNILPPSFQPRINIAQYLGDVKRLELQKKMRSNIRPPKI